jgi:hypothetical protein
MADDGLDRGSAAHLAADGGSDTAHLAADPDTEFVRVAVAAIALVDMNAAGLDAGQRLQLGDHRPERVAVIRVAVQRHLAGHGGEHRAVFVYQLDSYHYWESELRRNDFTYGQFGENFTVDGLSDQEVCIGDRYRVGGALFEVTQPRVTCYRVGIRMNEPQMAALLVGRGRWCGDESTLSHRNPSVTLRLAEANRIIAGAMAKARGIIGMAHRGRLNDAVERGWR